MEFRAFIAETGREAENYGRKALEIMNERFDGTACCRAVGREQAVSEHCQPKNTRRKTGGCFLFTFEFVKKDLRFRCFSLEIFQLAQQFLLFGA